MQLDDSVEPVTNPELPEPKVGPTPDEFVGTPYTYQHQGSAFLLCRKRALLGDCTGAGKTIEALLGVAAVHAKTIPNPKVLVVTVNSTVLQWKSEIQKFLPGFRPVVLTSLCPPPTRYAICKQLKPKDILIINYSLLRNDTSYLAKTRPRAATTRRIKKVDKVGWLEKMGFDIVIYDEAAVFKNYQTAVFQAARAVATPAKYVWALTAYAMSNNPMEVFGIYSVIRPEMFGVTRTDKFGHPQRFMGVGQFKGLFTKQKQIRTKNGAEIFVYDGGKNLSILKGRIAPAYLGRNYSDLGSQLPSLIEKQIHIQLGPTQRRAYDAIENDLLGTALFTEVMGEVKLTTMDRPQNILTKMIQMQKVINGLSFFDSKIAAKHNENPKFVEIERLLDGEFANEKIVIFSKFRTYIDELEKFLRACKKGYNAVRITGSENQAQREINKDKFMNDPKCRVMMMSQAGGMGLNLQAARGLLLIDMPFSFGQLGQIVGRIRRTGSTFKHVVVCYFVAEDTFDEHVMGILKRKKLTIEAVFGAKDLMGDVEQVDTNFSVGMMESIANSRRGRK